MFAGKAVWPCNCAWRLGSTTARGPQTSSMPCQCRTLGKSPQTPLVQFAHLRTATKRATIHEPAVRTRNKIHVKHSEQRLASRKHQLLLINFSPFHNNISIFASSNSVEELVISNTLKQRSHSKHYIKLKALRKTSLLESLNHWSWAKEVLQYHPIYFIDEGNQAHHISVANISDFYLIWEV